ncbi:MAG TPA: DNA-processing protein DprA [Baekduia sp.]|nr:DNA-processing protein DprA [Baekduia sp.]
MSACDDCLRRGFVLELLAGRIEIARHERSGLRDVLALSDEQLVKAVGGEATRELLGRVAGFHPDRHRARTSAASLSPVCRHDDLFPPRLIDDATVHALYVAGSERLGALTDPATPAVAIVGTRRASPDGMQTARELGRGLAAAGVTVVSGMALGIDAAAHEGALEGGGRTIAVLGCGADVAYPRSKAALHRRIAAQGVVLSEMPAGATVHRWGFPARNRIIAGLAHATVVVEAAQKSGSLITADFALELGRDVLAVPGSVRSWRADGTNSVIRDGGTLVRDARDVLDAVVGPQMAGHVVEAFVSPPDDLEPEVAAMLEAVEGGVRRTDELIAVSGDTYRALSALAELEMMGLVRGLQGGGYERTRL